MVKSLIVIFLVAIVAAIGHGNEWCVIETAECRSRVIAFHSHEQLMELAREKHCASPQRIAEVDGVTLYALNHDVPGFSCPEREVFFSKSGTQTTHTERHGKATRTYDDITPSRGE